MNARERIVFEPRESPNHFAAAIALETRAGRTLMAEADVGIPVVDPAAQWDRLTAKARSIAVPVIGDERVEAMIAAVDGLDEAVDLGGLMRILA